MDYYLIMCRSLTYAQRALYTMERSGISGSLVKVPQSVSQTGCSYGVKLPARRIYDGVELLKKRQVPYGKIFRYLQDGTMEEVSI